MTKFVHNKASLQGPKNQSEAAVFLDSAGYVMFRSDARKKLLDMSENYNSNDYERVAQRFVYPIFLRDDLGNIHFSSTMTFVKYKDEYFSIFAAHALPTKDETIDNIGSLTTDGKFNSLSEISKGYKIYREQDIVICNTTAPLQLKNYFDLDSKDSSTEFHKNHFSWIGFPKKKAKSTYHRTQSSEEHIKSHLSTLDDGLPKWNNANYLIVDSKVQSITDMEITGEFNNKNIKYKYEGEKQQGYSLKGMSGGALFYPPKQINTDTPLLSDIYQFAGIGLEYQQGKLTKGASKTLVKSLIENYLDNK